ncbi:replication initiator protein [Capybara microvirus Cap1_SP_216]|nr:replication initiator protein [Capybara microvirus Cap1_SP_216]
MALGFNCLDCFHTRTIKRPDNGSPMVVPCGNCMACRIARSREWSLRLLMELESHDFKGCFITLTYDDEHLPNDYGLHKEDLKNFWKRLRKDLDFKIKYYACGEYGDTYGRPHYHAIIFGLDPDDFTRRLLVDNWRFCSPDRFNGTKQGLADVTIDSINYVTGYIQKKYNGDLAKEVYGELQPPFSSSSQGLGLETFLKNRERFENDGYIGYQGVKYTIPRYFIKKLDLEVSKVYSTEKVNEYLEKNGIDPSRFVKATSPNFIKNVAYHEVADPHLAIAERRLLRQKQLFEKDKLK